MDLGLKGRRAIVCASSKGLGRACAASLAREGVDVTITARNAETLEATAREILASPRVTRWQPASAGFSRVMESHMDLKMRAG